MPPRKRLNERVIAGTLGPSVTARSPNSQVPGSEAGAHAPVNVSDSGTGEGHPEQHSGGGETCPSNVSGLAEARLPDGSGKRPDGAFLAEALGRHLSSLDDESRTELLENSLEGLER